jgi:hypothetical protein
VLPCGFPSGRHPIAFPATSADGETQPESRADPFPSGATGWHTIQAVAA